MGDQIRLSVIVALTQEEALLAETVQSVLASDLRQIEVIVVAPAPLDLAAALSGFRDPRLQTLSLRVCNGLARARNVGVARARAPYLVFLAPPDLLASHTLRAAEVALGVQAQAGFAFGDYQTGDEQERNFPAFLARSDALTEAAGAPLGEWSVVGQTVLRRALAQGKELHLSGTVLRRQILTEIGPFDESLGQGSELDLLFRLTHRCEGLYWNRVARVHRARLSGDDHPELLADRIAVLQRELQRSSQDERRQLKRFIARSYAGLAYSERRRHERLRSMALFAQAFATSPDIRWLGGILGSLLS